MLRQLDILVYPPAINILLLLAALFLWRRRRTAITLVVVSTVTLVVFSLPITSHRLALMLEEYPAIPPLQLKTYEADAIVVLGAGVISYANEYQDSSLMSSSLTRLRYAAFVQKQTGLPLLVSGGFTGKTGSKSEAGVMQSVLASDYGIDDVSIESNSLTTRSNAVRSASILKQCGMQSIFLITSGLHMRRAVDRFTRSGIDVVPAPTYLNSDSDVDWQYFIPSGDGLSTTRQVLHEYLGVLWYRLSDILDSEEVDVHSPKECQIGILK